MALRIYTNGLDEWRAEILQAFAAQVADLDLGSYEPEVFDDDTPDLPENAVVLYFSSGTPADADNASLEAHLRAGRAVIPVVDDLAGVPSKLPACLHGLNAYAVGEPGQRKYGRLVDEIVTRLWLRRSVRKVFLSYKRSDSSAVAHRLRDELTRRGYEVFLDECTLQPGVAVQKEIYWWLNDADLVLLLGTPNLGKSEWVAKEIAVANATEVPLLVVVWPDPRDPGKPTRLPAGVFSHQEHRLHEASFVDLDAEPHEQNLTDDALGTILERLEKERTLAVRDRLGALLQLLRDAVHPRFNATDTSVLGDLLLDDPDGNGPFYLRVLPFRPTVQQAWDLHAELKRLNPVPTRAFLFYSENDPDDPRRKALDWVFEPVRPTEPRQYSLLNTTDLEELS